eukprot:TRINITY_DN34690_c0_g1_i1.p1 TRINITY_DN34690_c0_g1~~TRINITY_DN34690_c0_g1_i1.p1  ORF type:complete len:946 (+),score=181.83 TRINITY_DN34690_c0_g1_i1:127-2964(+)
MATLAAMSPKPGSPSQAGTSRPQISTTEAKLARRLSAASNAASDASPSRKPPVNAILTENERLRSENAKLRQLRAHRSSLPSQDSLVRSELQVLRSRNAELEQQVRGSSDGAALVADSKEGAPPPLSAEDVALKLQPARGRGRDSFHIRGWETERRLSDQGANAATDAPKAGEQELPATASDALVPVEVAGVIVVPGSAAAETDAADDGGSVTVFASSGVAPPSSWLGRCSLVSSRGPRLSCAEEKRVEKLCAEVVRHVANGYDEEAIAGLLSRIYAEHLQDVKRPHLGFSALFPRLFVDLQKHFQHNAGGDGGTVGSTQDSEIPATPVQEVDMSQGTPRRETAPTTAQAEAFDWLARLIKRLTQTSAFGERPPLRRPESITRERWVREIISQAGLSLDLARIGFVQRQQRATANREKKNAAKPGNEDPAAASSPVAVSPGVAAAEPATAESPRSQSSALPAAAAPVTPKRLPRSTSGSKRGLQRELSQVSLGATPSATGVERRELEAALARAGRYLSVLQMDMERLRLKAEADVSCSGRELRREATVDQLSDIVGLSPSEVPAATSPSQPDPTLALVAVEADASANADGATARVSPPTPLLPLMDADVEASMLPLQEGGGATQEELEETFLDDSSIGSALPDGLSQGFVESSPGTPGALSQAASTAAAPGSAAAPEMVGVDPLVTPTFGEFLEHQLLPLYIADVPFRSLKHLSEQYWGLPLDSDDEERTLKAIGRPKTRAPLARRTLRRNSLEKGLADSETASSAVAAGAGATQDRSFSELCREGDRRGSAHVLRAQMTTSVAEKRRSGQHTTRDMEVRGMVPPPPVRTTMKVAPSKDGKRKADGTAGTSKRRKKDLLPPVTPARNGLISSSPVTPSLSKLVQLLQTPKHSHSVSRGDIAGLAAPSPLSTRAVRRPSELLNSSSLKRTRHAPSWELLGETPQRS